MSAAIKAACQITLLGTGSSGGVPRVGGDWGSCDPAEPRNRRRRCCVLVDRIGPSGGKTRALIDTSPDLREQLLAANVTTLDAVIYTHDHADQTHGIDDLRALVQKRGQALPVHMDAPTAESMIARFQYCFTGKGGYAAILNAQPAVIPYQALNIIGAGGALTLLPLELVHGDTQSLGFRIGDLAYINDVNAIPDRTLMQLTGLDCLIVDALRRQPHPTHAHLARTLDWIAALKPRRAVLTNMHVDMDYKTLMAELPAGVEPGYDGQVIDFTA
jgi:phosphoribosyl 1,2-cyclic phosphate phosphodiesterase